jgi:outer membrane phospholipase A
MFSTTLSRAGRCAITLLTLVLCATPAHAGLIYALATHEAQPNDELTLSAVLFNDTPSVLNWTPPRTLKVRWHNAAGQVTASSARLVATPQNVALPVNTFARFEWQVQVPAQARGLQGLEIDGQPERLAVLIPVDSRAFARSNPADPTEPPRTPEPQTAAGPGSPAMGIQGSPVDQTSSASSDLSQRFSNAISPHEPVYFDVGGKGGLNARFQISLKYRLFTPDDPTNPGFADSLYLGYTQTSLWDLASDSLPFIDTSFKPSLFWHRDALWQSQDKQTYLGLASGVEHESNGKDGDQSRSLNNVFIQPEFNYRFDQGSTLTFAPRIKSYFATSNNPDYTDYAGYVDWRLRWAQDNGLILSGLYRQGKSGHHTTQLEAAWPLKRTFLNMNGYLHVQYFQGYGQTLLGYNQKSEPQVRIGLSLIP